MGEGSGQRSRRIDIGGTALERLILDTTVFIASERGHWELDEVIQDDDDVAIAAVTAAELLVGVELAHSRHRSHRSKFVHAVLESFHIEAYDLRVARVHARLLGHVRRSGRTRGAHDLIIAATAASLGRVVITADSEGFDDLPEVAVRRLPPSSSKRD
ncbi:MAG: PIN domain-containing protein [Actinomycetota bacterium]